MSKGYKYAKDCYKIIPTIILHCNADTRVWMPYSRRVTMRQRID